MARKNRLDASVYDSAAAPYFTPEMLAEGYRLFERAEFKVATDIPALEEVRRARLGLEFVEYMRAPAGDPKKQWLAKTIADKIRHFGVVQTSEGGPAEDFLKRIGQ